MSSSAQCICNYIGLSWMVGQIKIIVLKIFHPPSLSQVQILLGKNVLQTSMICEHLKLLTILVVPPNFQCKYYCCHLQVMHEVVSLMVLQLARSISYHLPYCIKTYSNPVSQASLYTVKPPLPVLTLPSGSGGFTVYSDACETSTSRR